MLNLDKVKDFIIFTDKEFNQLLNSIFYNNKELTFGLFEVEKYLQKYKEDFYKQNQNAFINLQISNSEEITLFLPYYRVYTVILCKMCTLMVLRKNTNFINTNEIESVITILNEIDKEYKELENILIDNEVKFINQQIKKSFRRLNNSEKLDLINDYIKLLKNLIQEQINLNINLDIQFNLTNEIEDYKKNVIDRNLLDKYLTLIENLLKNGLDIVLKKLENQKIKLLIDKSKVVEPIIINNVKQIPDEQRNKFKERLNKINSNRQLVLVVLLAYHTTFQNEINHILKSKKSEAINNRDIMNTILNYFEYSDNQNILKAVQNFDIELFNKGSIINNEDKLLCTELENYFRQNEIVFLKMLKLRKKRMSIK